ncbi:probable E3 SUMO-protein ligase RNF212 isoform X7 [Bubalus kerabau]|uniref:probable E3 SUMO-protein ligase RNF212 isoform X6 n=1 Tax=Bubalus bubalis TaxID=89462 RepID=UPI000DBC4C75|nr:probable E3 SUMO-protein ligase RNF212 isoform X6 [Bubalus bubalis]XP_055445291.1 probable E3 SUMO-protein ligase RNF212 isoform X7 [Bubalus carabanensis]
MASWVFCNRCFQPPQATSCFSLTNCGHVYCDACLRKGKRDECLICKVACRTVLLSKHTDPNIQALFMGVDSLCMKYAKETSQISEFQEKHRRRLLAFYGEKISQLEESLRKSTLRVEQLQRVRSSQQTAFSTGNTTASTPSAKPSGPPVFQPRGSSASERSAPSAPAPSAGTGHRVESMEADLMPSPRRKPEVATGPPRISLLSPPRDGRMGSIAHRPQHLGLTPRCSSEPQSPRIPVLQMPCEWPRQSLVPAASRGAAPRQPISISGLMQRQRPGPAGLRGLAHECQQAHPSLGVRAASLPLPDRATRPRE